MSSVLFLETAFSTLIRPAQQASKFMFVPVKFMFLTFGSVAPFVTNWYSIFAKFLFALF